MTTTQKVNEVMYRRGEQHPYTPLQLIGALREMFAFRFSPMQELDEMLEGPSKAQVLAASLDLNEAWFRIDKDGNYVFDRNRRLEVLARRFELEVGRTGVGHETARG